MPGKKKEKIKDQEGLTTIRDIETARSVEQERQKSDQKGLMSITVRNKGINKAARRALGESGIRRHKR